MSPLKHSFFFFFNDTATTEIYTLSLHDALPIYRVANVAAAIDITDEHRPALRIGGRDPTAARSRGARGTADRKSTRLNSSHANISYAVFCLKKKKKKNKHINSIHLWQQYNKSNA